MIHLNGKDVRGQNTEFRIQIAKLRTLNSVF